MHFVRVLCVQELCGLEPKAAFLLERKSRGDQASPQSNGEMAPSRNTLAMDSAYRGRRYLQEHACRAKWLGKKLPFCFKLEPSVFKGLLKYE